MDRGGLAAPRTCNLRCIVLELQLTRNSNMEMLPNKSAITSLSHSCVLASVQAIGIAP